MRRGIGLIEMVVVLGLLMILIGLLLPAVGWARNRSLQLACGANLRQIGVAMAAYQANHHCYPLCHGLFNMRPGAGPLLYFPKFISPHIHMMPYLGETVIYDHLNFADGFCDMYDWRFPTNDTALSLRARVYACPADPEIPVDDPLTPAGNNYRACVGSGPVFERGKQRRARDGGFDEFKATSPSDIQDGFGQTVAFSEKVRSGPAAISFSHASDFVIWPVVDEDSDMPMAKRCDALAGAAGKYFGRAGATWGISETKYTLYNHVLGPNSSTPDCGSTGFSPAWGAFAARSLHTGGVHCLMFDGSVHFVSDGVDLAVWRAAGTRAGGESTTGL